ncbi:hypothetical protein SADUNF_Sadunf16G0027400 [Salix dunnii]|uniref:NAC domain-containing protein n=1 Tax=Salix dunnii TaxID=1413687 RepID=A0A835MKQ6_9ROSI|nr:hypothetical protein SADUNF_Sadunf16G0027400 [Salix dunnii]
MWTNRNTKGTLASLPTGFKFRSDETELIGYYLLNKVVRILSHEDDIFVKDYNVYSEEPWKFMTFTDIGEGLYFFITLKTATAHGSRFDRKVGDGTWHDEGETFKLKLEKKVDRIEEKIELKDSGFGTGWLLVDAGYRSEYLSRNQLARKQKMGFRVFSIEGTLDNGDAVEITEKEDGEEVCSAGVGFAAMQQQQQPLLIWMSIHVLLLWQGKAKSGL